MQISSHNGQWNFHCLTCQFKTKCYRYDILGHNWGNRHLLNSSTKKAYPMLKSTAYWKVVESAHMNKFKITQKIRIEHKISYSIKWRDKRKLQLQQNRLNRVNLVRENVVSRNITWGLTVSKKNPLSIIISLLYQIRYQLVKGYTLICNIFHSYNPS